MAVSTTSIGEAWAGVQRRAPRLVVDAVRAVRHADVLVFAPSLAFYALVSAVPLAVLSFWALGSLIGPQRIDRLVDFLVRTAPAGESIAPFLDNLLRTGTGVGIGAIVAALWPATAFGSGLGRAFARLGGDDDPAPGLLGRVKALALVGLLPLFLLGALGMAYLAPGLFGEGTAGAVAGWSATAVVAVAATWLFVLGVYGLFSPRRPSWRSVALAALGASVVITVAGLGFAVYLAHGADWRQRAAGSGAGTAVLFGLWLYVANAVMLVGHCVATALDRNR